MKIIHVIGMGMGLGDVTSRQQDMINNAQVLAGGPRLLDLFPDHTGERLPLKGKLDAWLDAVDQAAGEQAVAVLASGDPGFFGVGSRLVRRFGPHRINIIPNITTAQAAFARLGRAWQEAKVISLHGREQHTLLSTLSGQDCLALFTDPHNSPDVIARLLLDRDQGGWSMQVLENLGAAHEKVEKYSLEQAAETDFSPLNLVVLDRTIRQPHFHLGMPDESYEHQAGLITKAEIRAAALSKLELGPGLTLWDLGAGCGSVGLEASLLMPGGRIIAVERQPQRVEQIKANRARFQAANLEVVCGELPGAIDQLPQPDRVFIGGGGDGLAEIVRSANAGMTAGVMVASGVRLAALETARQVMRELGMDIEIVQVQVSRGHNLAGDLYLKALNPVWLIKGTKKASGETL